MLSRKLQGAGGTIGGGGLPVTANLEIWLDASDISTLFQDSAKTTPVTTNGDSVECWEDKSGNGYDHIVQSGIGVPTYDSSTMYAGSLDFDGTQSLYDSTSKDTITAFFVAQTDQTTSQVLFGYDSANNRYIHYDVGGVVYFTAPDSGFSTVSGYSGMTVNTASVIAVDLRNFINVNFTRYDATTALNYTGGSPCGTYIGRRNNDPPSAAQYVGNIAEVITYSRRLSSTEIQDVEDYLNIKWNLGLSR